MLAGALVSYASGAWGSDDELIITSLKAGITEHSVMFPADMIKVTTFRVMQSQSPTHCVYPPPPHTDADAGLHHITGSDVHGHWQRIQSDICDGGLEGVVEGCLFCHLGSRSCARGAFWYLRVCKRVDGWER